MKLLIDAGNTSIKWGIADGGNWFHSGVLPLDQSSDLARLFAGFSGIQQIWVSNVAGAEVAQQIRNIRVGQAGQPYFIVAQDVQCGVRNGYSDAGQLGSDRWAALIAAWHLVRSPCLVVNSGTATTIDALSEQGEFLGGLIVPGLELMQRNLIAATDQLKPGRGEYAPFPQSTADAIYSGAIQANCGAIMQQYALMGDGSSQIVLSGGAAAVLRDHIKAPLLFVEDLVLKGLLLIAQETGK